MPPMPPSGKTRSSGGGSKGVDARLIVAVIFGIGMGCGVAYFNGHRTPNPYHSTTEHHIPSNAGSVSFATTAAQETSSAQCNCQCEHAASGGGGQVPAAVVATPDPLGKHAGRESECHDDLHQLLLQIAPNKEVMAAVSNKALITPDGGYGMLKTWVDGCKRSGLTNYMVIALDDHTYNAMKAIDVPVWKAQLSAKLRDMAQTNHGISGQKFQFLREFLLLGYSVLLSDVDIVTLQNPFEHLYRDSDVEGLSDGFDDKTSYGWMDILDDPGMGWARYVHTVHWYVMNSGLFFIQPNEKTVDLMDRITMRLQKEKAWDQAVFNEEIFYPSHGKYKASLVSVRVMNHLDFMNSKTLFKYARQDWRIKDRKPVMVHVNYHPDKWPRMQAIEQKWVHGNMKALDKFPVGSNRRRRNFRRKFRR